MQAFSSGYAEQAVFAVDLRERVEQLRDQSSDVDRQLAEQADQIATLVQAARAIRDELSGFRMAPSEPPAAAKRGGQD
jgi:pilus assembly protein TadC